MWYKYVINFHLFQNTLMYANILLTVRTAASRMPLFLTIFWRRLHMICYLTIAYKNRISLFYILWRI